MILRMLVLDSLLLIGPRASNLASVVGPNQSDNVVMPSCAGGHG